MDDLQKTVRTLSKAIQRLKELKKERLSAGICDHCSVPSLINIGGDGIHEPWIKAWYCHKKELVIDSQAAECQILDCNEFSEK